MCDYLVTQTKVGFQVIWDSTNNNQHKGGGKVMGEEGKTGTKICPQCEMENPRNRLTCQVCHAPLNAKEGEKKKAEKKGPDPFTGKESVKDPSPAKDPEPKKRKGKVTVTAPKVVESPPKSLSGNSAEVASKPIEKSPERAVEPETSPAPVASSPRPRKRPRKKVVKAPEAPHFFLLDEAGNLRAVLVRLIVSKPIKGKLLTPSERSAVALVNRNKDLLSQGK